MLSDSMLTQISDGVFPSIHSYFDLCPESPDGSRVVYFRFLEGPPGAGQVVVCERDGTNHRVIADVSHAGAHPGAFQQWVGNDAVAFSTREGDAPRTLICSLIDGSVRALPVSVRMFAPSGRLGLSSSHENRLVGAEDAEDAVYLTDVATGEVRTLFTRADVAARHPLLARGDDLTHLAFKHTKWAQDETRFFVVYTNEVYMRGRQGTLIKSLITVDADSWEPRYLSEFGHHPMWGGDGTYAYAFHRLPEGGQNLTIYPLDGSAPYPLLSGIPGVHPSLSPNGALAVADTMNWPEKGRGAIVLFDVATGQQRVLVTMRVNDNSHETGCHPHPVWSRDGKRIYFNTDDGGAPRVYAVEV